MSRDLVRACMLAAVALVLIAADAPGRSIAHKTADYAVTLQDGAVAGIKIRSKDGGALVLGAFDASADGRQAEARNLAAVGCADAACRATCRYAAEARPFRTITRFDARGRRLWSWRANRDTALQLLSSGGDDCLSPDGRFATVSVFMTDGAGGFTARAGPAVLRLSPRPAFVKAQGLGSAKDAVVGWRADAPATLVVESDAGVEHDGPPEYVETRFGR